MSSVDSQSRIRRSINITRVLFSINFVIFLLLIGPVGRNREIYKTIRESGFAPLMAAVPLWFVGTTLFVTALFVWKKIKKSNEVTGQAPRNAALDGKLLLIWWGILILSCLYAFMMGMGG